MGENVEFGAVSARGQTFVHFDKTRELANPRFVACKTATHEHFFVVRWGDTTIEDIDRVIKEVRALIAEQAAPVYYLGILPEDMPKIDEGQRDEFLRLSELLLPECGVFAVAIEAKGFRGAIQRSAMAAITLLTRRYRGLRFVDSIGAALAIEPDALPDGAGVAAALQAVGAEAPSQLVAS